MNPPALKIGCQTYTWEMLGDGWNGGPDDLVAAIAGAGYAGLEITDTMIGAYADRPADFARRLEDAGLALAAFAMGSDGGFTEPSGLGADLEAVRRWADFLGRFPGAVLSMGSATAMSEGDLAAKFAIAADVYNRAAEIGRRAGVAVAVHPSSHQNTLLFTRGDYDRIFALLDSAVGWVPDTGHILRGGQVIGDTLAAHRDRIVYLHLKDVDREGTWAMLGQGACDVPAVIEAVAQAPRFNGWIIAEEESATAAADPTVAVRTNRATLRSQGYA
ncbi:MAG: sugar phosphate isomerase/epimerase [Amaricoccus sp.]